MILRVTAVTFLSLFMVSGLFAQRKVGTAPRFLLMSPSVRGIAMGQTGVTSYDSRSYYFNPGTLALLDVTRLALSINPISSTLSEFGITKTKIHSKAASVRLIDRSMGSGSFALAFGYMFTTLSIGPFIETTESFPEGTGRVFDFTDRAHSFSIAGGYKGPFELGIGTTVRYIKEDILDVHIDGVAFDIGTVLRLPIIGSLTDNDSNATHTRLAVRAGVSVTNFGSGFSGNVPFGTPLPRRGRFGLGLDFASGMASLSPVVELTIANNDEKGDFRFGMEAGLFNTIFVRAGHVGEDVNGFSETSYGFGFSTNGLREIIAKSSGGTANSSQDLFGYIAKNLNLTFSFAHLESERIGFDDPNFYQIEITL